MFYIQGKLTDVQLEILGKYGSTVFFTEINLQQVVYIKKELPYFLQKCAILFDAQKSVFFIYSQNEQIIIKILDELANGQYSNDTKHSNSN